MMGIIQNHLEVNPETSMFSVSRAGFGALLASALAIALTLAGCAPVPAAPAPDRKQQVALLLKSLETGDPGPQAAIDPNQYIQHNHRAADGLAGLRAFLKSRPAGSVKVNTVRLFGDGDFVFAHSEYLGASPRIGFDVFRFENGRIVEHWDNLQAKAAQPSPGGHSMTDGSAQASELEKTAANKALMQAYMDDLLQGRREKFTSYFDGNNYIQHSPLVADNLTGLFAGLQTLARQGLVVKYDKVRRILGEGDFVLVIAEGSFGGKPSAYYDLYRLRNGKIAEHWDTIEEIPPPAEWKNANGKF
jgi:predicted SnoaL-like aldol condensation-catalyzing enzyme